MQSKLVQNTSQTRMVARSFLSKWPTMLCLLGMSMLLAGCSSFGPKTQPTKTFEVNVPLKQVYERTLEQTKMCLVTRDNFPITSQIDAAQSFAFVRVNMTFTDRVLSNVRIIEQGPSRSRVTVQMWGVDVWNMTAVDAMQAAIEFGVPSCVNYFPSKE